MKNRCTSPVALVASLLLGLPALAQDFVVPTGQTVVYDTTIGPLQVTNFVIQPGAQLRVLGPKPFVVQASQGIVIDGLLDLSGQSRPDVATLQTGQIPEVGAQGVAGGGQGGVGSFLTTTSTPMGGAGFGGFGQVGLGGGGGEAGFGVGPKDAYRGAGGGGGRLGPDLPLQALPGLIGVVGQAGSNGGSLAQCATLGLMPPQGGAPGASAFVDGNSANDFWGVKVDPMTGAIIQGELRRPRAGTGGGAGGDGVQSAVFPATPWTPASDKKGCGGGGGGGLGLMKARFVSVGLEGRVQANGGRGGAGENQSFLDHICGGSGGGSGGFLVLQADLIDLSLASVDCLRALGGAGGAGQTGAGTIGAGGAGGAGVIQLHLQNPNHLVLPACQTLADLSVPDAHVLRPIL